MAALIKDQDCCVRFIPLNRGLVVEFTGNSTHWANGRWKCAPSQHHPHDVAQTWNFVSERARPFSFWKGHFHVKIVKSMGSFWWGSKVKTRGNSLGVLVHFVTQGLVAASSMAYHTLEACSVTCKRHRQMISWPAWNFLLRGQDHFHFAKGTSMVKLLGLWGSRGHSLCVIPGLVAASSMAYIVPCVPYTWSVLCYM